MGHLPTCLLPSPRLVLALAAGERLLPGTGSCANKRCWGTRLSNTDGCPLCTPRHALPKAPPTPPHVLPTRLPVRTFLRCYTRSGLAGRGCYPACSSLTQHPNCC